MDRRTFAASALLALPGLARASACVADGFVYASSETGEIHLLRFDACVGKLESLGAVATVSKPRWLLVHPDLPLLYAVSDANGGSVLAFARDRKTGALTKLGEASSGGAGPTHLLLSGDARALFVANYAAGSVSSIAVAADGSLGATLSTLQASGSGPHRRQTGPHAHGLALAPGGRELLVADLGADRLFVHGIAADGRLSAGRELALPPGSGPRHVVAASRHLYLLNELTATLSVLRWEQGRAQLQQTLALASAGFKGTPSASELQLSADGRHLYVGDRGEHRLLVYRVAAGSGELTLLQRIASGGERPWHFELHASGRWLLVANHAGNRLSLFAVDPASGELRDSTQGLDLATPLCVAFIN